LLAEQTKAFLYAIQNHLKSGFVEVTIRAIYLYLIGCICFLSGLIIIIILFAYFSYNYTFVVINPVTNNTCTMLINKKPFI
jgi:hypothetical protein